MISTIFKTLGWFLLTLALQALVFDHVHILGHATPFVAVYFVLLFPGNSSRSAMLLWSFALGVIADTFTDTPGVAAIALTTTAMIQPWLLNVNSTIETDDEIPLPSARKMGWGSYIRYISLGTVFCEAIFHLCETFSFFNWMELLVNAGSSSLITILIIAAIESVRTGGGRRSTE
jgi:membrane-bound ClpP family serine protease